jgi:CCR4-NOT transcription complex subunit 1
VDRFIQEHPPNFNEQARADLEMAIRYRYSQLGQEVPPPEVLAALYLTKFIQDHNPLVHQIRRIGSGFTSDEETCTRYLHNMTNVRLDEEQVGSTLLYCAISRTPELSTVVFLNSVRKEVSRNFNWPLVIGQFDREDLRVSPEQFLSLYKALKPLAEGEEPLIDIQSLWGGHWQYSETHISFISAYSSLSPDQLDATTIPGLQPAFTLDDYTGAIPEVRELALEAVKHPLVSLVALDAIFHVALQSANASDTPEAKRLFQKVVVPHLDVFLVSAFGIPKPWPDLANDTVNSLFDRFLYKIHPNYDFVLSSIWRKDMNWVTQRLVDTHARTPLDLPLILEHAVKHGWLYDLLGLNGFGLDFAALAHAEGHLDLELWQRKHSQHPHELAQMLLTFLNIKAQHELQVQRHEGEQLLSVMLPVKTISALLNILTAILPRSLTAEQMLVQRTCITAYPRLINYGEGFDDIIDANGRERNSLPKEANDKMEEHYKRMYSEEIKVRTVVEALLGYKHSRNPADQDVFACMIHGLFDEYALYSTYPLEALKTTAVLFGGIIKAKLLPDLPLEVALGMILDAVKDNSTDQPMYKFGLEALKQTLERFHEWPGFCRHLVHIPGLQGTDVWAKAEEVSREQDDASRSGNGIPSANESINSGAIANGNFDEMLSPDPSVAPFTSIHVDPLPYNSIYEEPSGDMQEKVLFVLNNITERNLDTKFKELKEVIEERHQQWFAGHLVEERAKMQPNYHQLYLDLVRLFENKGLWSEVLRETYVSVIRMLNAEATMQSSTERTHLKNLGGWLGSLTLARDKPIKHRNIAFKQLLLEAFDTQRLIVVIPFVCKVLLQGASSTVFKPPNPWLMDIIHLLIELYHHAELKLNLKFEIEVLCKGLNLDHKSIEPSTDIQTRLPPIDEPTEPTALEVVDRFDSLSMNGMSTVVGNGRFSPQDITSSIPDLGPLLVYPPANDMVNQSRLQDIVRTAITRAVHEIISPVVERSVTIAAISTAQMIHKDFATEPDENRVRSAAINMVKRTAGSLALVTSKEPLRASMSNYIRAASVDLPQGLPEGTIIMCVNSNLDMACSQVEKKAEERAIPEIEDMIEPELEARRRHRATRPNEPYVDPSLSRWAMTIPNPYKLLPGTPGGLNQEQMAIYDEFARQPRIASHGVSTHGTSTSDATRSMANDILQDQYPAVSSIPTPAEQPAMPHGGSQLQGYGQLAAGISNGRAPAPPVDPRGLADRITELLDDLVRTATNAHEQHYMDLPRPHPIIDIVDALISLIIRNTQVSDDASRFTAEHILQILFSQVLDDELAIESLVHVLEMLCKFPGTTSRHVIFVIGQQPDELLLSLPLVLAMIKTEIGLLDWQRVDRATAKLIQQHKLSALDFLSSLVNRVLLVDRPVALYTDFARSFEAVNRWLGEEPTLEQGQRLMESLKSSGLMQNIGRDGDDQLQAHKDQMGYVFDEWVNLSNSLGVTDGMINHFIEQLHDKQIVTDQENTVMFLRICIDTSVQRFEHHFQNQGPVNDAYLYIDALAKLIIRLVKQSGERLGEVQRSKMTYFDALVSLILLVLNHHHVIRGEAFNQKVFFRLFSTMMCEFNSVADHFSENDRKQFYQVLAEALLKLQPSRYPGFTFGWISLISHRDFMPHLLRLPGQDGWEPLARLVEALLLYLGELLKQLHLTLFTKDIYRGTLKLLVVLHHDSPEFLAGYHTRLCAAIPPHCIQLHNIILTAGPSAFSKMPDPLQPGLKIDRVEDIRESPQILADVALPLKQADLFDLVTQALQSGPSEDAVAHITHTIQRKKGQDTTAGYMAIHADLELIDSLVLYIGMHSIEKAIQKGGPLFIQGSPDAALLTMLVHELNPEARYYFLNSIVNQLRFPNAHTHYFSQALLEVFGNDLNDQEESDIRQQITRIMLERLIGPWPQPWGLLITIFELVKNDKYMFFDLPFIKSAPEVSLHILLVIYKLTYLLGRR